MTIVTGIYCQPRHATQPDFRRVVLVLLIDDDKDMLKSYIELLQHANYQVDAHHNPQQALQQFQLNPNAYDAVLTDYNMPNMDGLALIAAIHDIRPDLKIILYSGMLPKHVPDYIITFTKPTRIDQLLKALAA